MIPHATLPALDDVVDRLLALRRLAIVTDESLVHLIDIALLRVAQLGIAGGVVADQVLSFGQPSEVP